MSFLLPFSKVTPQIKEIIKEHLLLIPPPTKFNPSPEPVKCYYVDATSQTIIIPFAMWWRIVPDAFPTPLQPVVSFSTTIIPFTLETDPKHTRDQLTVVNEAFSHLTTWGSVFLNLFTGFGKTSLGVYLASKLQRRAMVVCHIDSVNRRWYSDFCEKSSARVKFVEDSQSIPVGYDVYIIGVMKLANTSRDTIASLGIGTVIVDEAHVCTMTCFTESLLKINTCEYLIGLSATNDRKDGLHIVFDKYFGGHDLTITRTEQKPFTVIKYKTPFQPRIEYMRVNGKDVVNWNVLKFSIENNRRRWEMIADIIEKNHPEENVLVICDLVNQTKNIHNILVARGVSSSMYVGNMKTYDATSRVLVGSLKKCGTGFDDSRFSVMIVATDMTDVRQTEGRLRMEGCTIYDIVDDHFFFEKHFSQREGWYIVRGATIIHITHISPPPLQQN